MPKTKTYYMTSQYLNYRNLRFLLFEMLEADKLKRFPFYADYDRGAMEMALDAAKQIADTHLYPYYVEMDRKKAVFEDGIVKTHPQLKTIIKAVGEGGWIAAHAPAEYGGMQMPFTLAYAGLLSFYSASVNACYPFLTQGAANLILNFASEELKQTYLPHMYSGDWQGTMALTEPQAGSSLTDITSSAEPLNTEGGMYKISGQKIYISGGDHDAVDNVVHLLLARIKGAPAGTKGISLFVVPKYRPENGDLVPNDVTCAGIYGKMGQKGYVAAHLMYGEKDNCIGYLVGQPHRGLTYMFQMMNEARIGTGLVAAGAASAAYYASLKYANERPQGRHPSNKDPNSAPVLIIEHADVKRMLLFQKAVTEGAIALLSLCSYYADVAEQSTDEEEKTNAHLLLELLTPIAKSYPSEMGVQSVSAAMQTLGGAGYCDDFPIELIYRDIRVNAIYEGTTGIHGLDLLGRKVSLHNGKATQLFGNEIINTATEALKHERLAVYAQKLGETAQRLSALTQDILKHGKENGPEMMLADATLYLDYFSTVTIAWMWLKQGIVAEKALKNGAAGEDVPFYESKIAALRYFFDYELPKTRTWHVQLANMEKLTVALEKEYIV
jgi:alkylation response protein AidB-like acyl-CoA dehydrogenase